MSRLARILSITLTLVVTLFVPGAAWAGPAPVGPGSGAETVPVVVQSSSATPVTTVPLWQLILVAFLAATVAAALVAVTSSLAMHRQRRGLGTQGA